jgi:hypothetical protein
MMLGTVWKGLESSAVGSFVAGSSWAFPTIECIHVIALVTVVGSIAVMDLRLLGMTSRACSVTATSRDTLPFTWGAFVLAVITGLLLFVSKASVYMVNPWFLLKMGALALAGANMAVFHLTTWHGVATWDANPAATPRAAKISAALSLLFWVCVVFFGRAIGFTLGIYEP